MSIFHKVAVALVLLMTPLAAFAAETPTCYPTYYKTKNAACVPGVLAVVHDFKPDPQNPEPAYHANAEGAIGFLAAYFTSYPAEKQKTLAADATPTVKGIYVEALYRAGLVDEAKTYADKNALAEVFQKYDSIYLPSLKAVHPSIYPSDNDLLIGAYMESGDASLIKSALENFTGASDGMVADGMRLGHLIGKFGPGLNMPGREPVTVAALCQKYQCRVNPAGFMRVMTLGSAYWSLHAMAAQDESIRKIVMGFFDSSPRLKNLRAQADSDFANYLTGLTAYSTVKDNATVNGQLTAYEKFEPVVMPVVPPTEVKK